MGHTRPRYLGRYQEQHRQPSLRVSMAICLQPHETCSDSHEHVLHYFASGFLRVVSCRKGYPESINRRHPTYAVQPKSGACCAGPGECCRWLLYGTPGIRRLWPEQVKLCNGRTDTDDQHLSGHFHDSLHCLVTAVLLLYSCMLAYLPPLY